MLRPRVDLVPEDAFGGAITPITERALGELHDIALVNNGQAGTFLSERVFDRGFDETNGANGGDGLDANADTDLGAARRMIGRGQLHVVDALLLRAETDLVKIFREFFREEIEDLLRFGRTTFPLDARIDVLGVFAENHHVHLFGMLDGRGDTLEPANGSQADVQVEHLAERDIQAADTFADRRGQRAFDADEIVLERLDGIVGQPVVEFLESGFARKNLQPFDLAFAAVRLFHRRVEHAFTGGPDIGSRAVAADEGNRRILGNAQFAILNRNLCHEL